MRTARRGHACQVEVASVGQRSGEPEDAQRAVVGEPAHGADLAAGEGEHEYPAGVGDRGLRVADDLLGVTLLTGGVVAIVWALVRANQSGWASAEIVSCLVSGAVLLLAFAAWEQRVSEPMVPLRLFRSRAFAAGNATTFLMTGAIFAAGFLVTQEFHLARGYSPVSAGVRLLPFFATPVFISPIAGAVSDRIGRRPVMTTGLFLQTAGTVTLFVE